MQGPDAFRLRELRAQRARQAREAALKGVTEELSAASQVRPATVAQQRPAQLPHRGADGLASPAPPQADSWAPRGRHPPSPSADLWIPRPGAYPAQLGQQESAITAGQEGAHRNEKDPLTGWASGDSAALAAPGDAKKLNATSVLASGFRKAHPVQEAPEAKQSPKKREDDIQLELAMNESANDAAIAEAALQTAPDSEDNAEDALLQNRTERRVSFEEQVGEPKPERHRKSRTGTSEERKLRRETKREAREVEAMEELRTSDQMAKLRKMVQKDPKALQHFLEALTGANPELMKLLASRRDEFMAMVLAQEEPKPKPKSVMPQETEIDPSCSESGEETSAEKKAKAPLIQAQKALRQRQRIERAFQPTTTSFHPLAAMFSPYSCAVCKATKAHCKSLMVCSACKSARFCGRDHQRAFWPRHQSVCKFLAACQGGLLADVSGKHWSTEALPQILNVWAREKGEDPNAFEYEQLVHLPRCHRCRKVPAPFVCEKSHSVGYCSEACRRADHEFTASWQCEQAMLTSLCANAMHGAGGGMPIIIGNPNCTLPDSVFEIGWQEYMTIAEITDTQNTGFLKLGPLAQQVIVDQLSYPMTVIEGLWLAGKKIENLCEGLEVVEVQILCPERGALSDMEKFEEWLNRAGSQVKTLNIRMVGPQMPVKEGRGHERLDYTKRLQESARQRGCKMFIHMYKSVIEEWLDNVAASLERRAARRDTSVGQGSDAEVVTPLTRKELEAFDDVEHPAFRVVYSPVFDQWPDGDQMDMWGPVLKRLAKSQDCVPLVVTEKLISVADKDQERAESYGLKTLVPPVTSSFASPLALVDDVSSHEENPCGLVVWNVALAVFEASERHVEEKDNATLEKEVQDMVATMAKIDARDFEDDAEERDELQASFGSGTAASAQGAQLPSREETTLLATESAARSEEEHLRGDSVLALLGPFHFDGASFEDVDHSPESNPEGSFSVQFQVFCEPGGKGYRCPLTSRDDPAAGYVFNVDDSNKWSFWVGDSGTKYWAGIQGPAVVMGVWTRLMGVVDTESSEIRLFVNGELAGTKSGVAFARNRQRPLRLGAGRSERSTPLFWFAGEVRDIDIRTWTAPDKSEVAKLRAEE